MMTWPEHLAFVAAEKKRNRIEWARSAAKMAKEQDISVPELARRLDIPCSTLQKVLRHAGIKTAYERKYTTTKAQVRTEGQRERAIILKQLRDRTARKVAAGMLPKYARLEAALEMQMEAGR